MGSMVQESFTLHELAERMFNASVSEGHEVRLPRTPDTAADDYRDAQSQPESQHHCRGRIQRGFLD